MRLWLETPILAQQARWSDAFYNINLYISEKIKPLQNQEQAQLYRKAKLRRCAAVLFFITYRFTMVYVISVLQLPLLFSHTA